MGREGPFFFFMAVFVFWLMFSFFGSLERTRVGNCYKNFPIDRVLYTKMLCEIKDVETGDGNG